MSESCRRSLVTGLQKFVDKHKARWHCHRVTSSNKPGELRNIQIRLNPEERPRVQRDIALLRETSVVEVKPGAYAKAALLAYPRFLRLEAGLRSLIKTSNGKTLRIQDINELLEAP